MPVLVFPVPERQGRFQGKRALFLEDLQPRFLNMSCQYWPFQYRKSKEDFKSNTLCFLKMCNLGLLTNMSRRYWSFQYRKSKEDFKSNTLCSLCFLKICNLGFLTCHAGTGLSSAGKARKTSSQTHFGMCRFAILVSYHAGTGPTAASCTGQSNQTRAGCFCSCF